MPPTWLFIERALGKLAQSANRFSIGGDCARGKQGARRLVHEGHEFIGKAGHGAADTDATDIGAPAYARHPTAFAHVALNNGSPAPQLHNALNVAVLSGEISLFIVATTVTPFMDR